MLTGEIRGFGRRSRRLSFGEKSIGNVQVKPLPVPEPVPGSSSKCSSSCARKRSSPNTGWGFVGADADEVASYGSCQSSHAPKTQDCEALAMSMVTSVSGMQTEMRKLSATLSRHDALVQEVRDAIKLLQRANSAISLNPVSFGHCATCRCCTGEATPTSKKRTIDSHVRTPGEGKGPSSRPTIDTKFTVDHMPFRSSRKEKPARKNVRPRKKSQPSPSPEVVDLTTEDVWDSPKCRKTPKEGNRCIPWSTRNQSDYNPAANEDLLDGWQGMAMKRPQIPRAMNLAFQPQNEMNLSPVELAVAAYVFCRDFSHSEILVDVGDCIANRAALMTLVPRAEVVDDVLNVVVRMLTRTSKQTQWFLPTSIMQAALEGRTLTSGTATSIRNNYMRCKVDRVTRIHQPMWCDGHWYLMIIDVPRMKLIYLDSLRDPAQAEARKIGMTRVALYLEGLTLGQSWLAGNCSVRPRFSTFEFEEPELPQQDPKSMDCGVWVAQWMIRDHLWQNYSVQNVSSATRMRLAVDLVMKSHNEMARDIVAKAVAHWQVEAE
ncbi:hypothetical protein HN51_007049 [Arachis hypogaea]|uniref:Ubiquitin-like protease family profile domain-containing protein n=2 Tax=Arachis hypogaea TaxID=3818 RepID=A0A444WQL8_ARAHY|nr:uncharacterized protein LOC112712086 isoform X2 [Arachis hypogaea]XP_025699099.1 uncharacterized protein LOC112800875 isoform X2 [Arachis hypogaea]QHO41107.1 Ulp1 protease family, carboxy-terminal domain protein [Arachis hypogaea]RYQ79715.1 hypothetical protein Ahy_Scaffold1g106589 isoform B [Arachis hypogaea]